MQVSFRVFLLFAAVIVLCFTACLTGAPSIQSTAEPVDHKGWDELLRKHVDDTGMVDYTGMAKDSNKLTAYLALLSKNGPNKKKWTKDQQMAYWINAYNAFTVKLILDHYPVASIKDIKNGIPFVSTVWDIKFFEIAGKEFDLNNIEHGILRKMDDPRIHFALVCASLSCPKLQPFAYRADQLDAQLTEAATEFFNEPFRNEISQNKVQLSKLLDWYWGDFKDKYETRIDLINTYSKVKVDPATEITYLEYNWNINDQAQVDRKVLGGGTGG